MIEKGSRSTIVSLLNDLFYAERNEIFATFVSSMLGSSQFC